jgi:hypothetical protein
MTGNRQKPTISAQGLAKAAEVEYNQYAGAKKVMGPILGKLEPLGAANPAVSVNRGSTIAFWNSDTAVHYVAMGTPPGTTPTTPTSPANGIPLPPSEYTILAMGQDNTFISDSALVYAFEVLDDSTWSPNNNPLG